MPYHIGGKGDSLGCKGGYGVIDSDTGEVVGCHPTRLDAEKQLAALHANVADAKGDGVAPANPSFTVDPKYPGAGIKRPQQGGGSRDTTSSNIKSKYGKKPKRTNTGRNSDNNSSTGAFGVSGSGMSMGTT